MSSIDFIGVGAQKCGTSWVYACLYEHPEICAPVKEIHFFSRPRFNNGYAWYEEHFASCGDKKRGEFSTSYLYAPEAPERIAALYPEVKIIAIIRNPLSRAVSHYKNALKAGEIASDVSFETFVAKEESALLQGKYYDQLERYYAHFKKEQVLVLVYEDSKKDPAQFIKKIYTFLGVDTTFVPSMLYREVNIARMPRFIFVDRVVHHVAEYLRIHGLGSLVHMVKKTGITDKLRLLNTDKKDTEAINTAFLVPFFRDDTKKLSALLQRDLVHEWEIV